MTQNQSNKRKEEMKQFLAEKGTHGLTYSERLQQLYQWIDQADAIVVGAGSGLSDAAGYVFGGPVFEEHFQDYQAAYGFSSAYQGSYHDYSCPEEYWAFWAHATYHLSRGIPTNPVYTQLLEILEGRNYFVITSNIDHQFQNHDIDPNRLYYMQGDFALLQCSVPCQQKTFHAEGLLLEMFKQTQDLKIPTELLPVCYHCGQVMRVNDRSDEFFVEDEGFHKAKARYETFLESHQDKRVLFLELGVGYNTPGIIKLPFQKMTKANPKARYVTSDIGRPVLHQYQYIFDQSLFMNTDLADLIDDLWHMDQEGMEAKK